MNNLLSLANVLFRVMEENNIVVDDGMLPYTLTFYYDSNKKIIGKMCLTQGIIVNSDGCNNE